ncbi:MAG: Tfp pilus assembly protein FimT/FimU [Gemmata sp.]
MTRRSARAGLGLVELLVSISIILLLAGLVIVMYPGARDQDRVRNTATDVGSTCKLAQAMAARNKRPCGVRFLVGSDPTNPAKTDVRWVTELQYVELPPPLIPSRTPLTTNNPDTEPRVRFRYTTAADGTITRRICVIENLSVDQAPQITRGCTLVLPTFGTWHQIGGAPPAPNPPTADAFDPIPTGPNASGLYTVQVALGTFPDATMGAGTDVLLYHFAVYLTATPLVGEPTVLLTKNVCVDLNAPQRPTSTSPEFPVGSIGPAPNTTNDFEVIFGPDGKLVNAPTGQLFLLVRDYTKGANFRVPPGAQLIDAFRRAGETHLVTIRSSGAIGYAPVTWPDNATGMYSGSGQDPFTLARQDLN